MSDIAFLYDALVRKTDELVIRAQVTSCMVCGIIEWDGRLVYALPYRRKANVDVV